MRSLKYAFVGSREWPEDLVPAVKDKIKFALENINQDSIILSGGAPGVDTWAEEEAKNSGFEVQVFKADWDKHGKSAGFIRNSDIANEADILIAFVFNDSRGTMDTVAKARKAGKEVILVKKNIP